MVHSVEIVRNPLYPPSEPPEDVVYWFMGEYLENYSVDVTVVHMDLTDEGVDGWCLRESDYEFIIQIEESLEGKHYKQTLLHEMYHVLQHLMNIPRCEMCAHLSEQINLDRFKDTM
tara:strand:- start:975 stop:1322 length:348 start_codon:yes stop_codon:yes gene_type:complete